MKEEKDEIKLEVQEQVSLKSYDYPKEDVKLQVDPEMYPPVRMYPLTFLSLYVQQMQNHQIISQESKLQQFIESMRTALLYVLSQEEKKNFVQNYDFYMLRPIYILMVIAFAKGRSNNRIDDFENILFEQIRNKNIPNVTSQLPQNDRLARTMRAYRLYIQGFSDKAVDELYGDYRENVIKNALNYITWFEKEIRNNIAVGPDFDSEEDSDSKNERNFQGEQEEDEDEGEDSQQQEERQYEEERPLSKEWENKRMASDISFSKEPFLITQRDSLIKQYLFPSEGQIKLRAKFADLIRK